LHLGEVVGEAGANFFFLRAADQTWQVPDPVTLLQGDAERHGHGIGNNNGRDVPGHEDGRLDGHRADRRVSGQDRGAVAPSGRVAGPPDLHGHAARHRATDPAACNPDPGRQVPEIREVLEDLARAGGICAKRPPAIGIEVTGKTGSIEI